MQNKARFASAESRQNKLKANFMEFLFVFPSVCTTFLIKCKSNFHYLAGCSKILGISPRFLEDFQSLSEDALLVEVVRKEFQQVAQGNANNR